jgi:myogenesis-regulating glycosidase
LFSEPFHWYGGPELKNQFWPTENITLEEFSFVTKEDENCAVIEPFWLNSNGTFFYVHKEVPLFVDQNNILDKHLCFISEVKVPYSSSRTVSELSYDIVFNKDAVAGQKYAVRNYFGKPTGHPDFETIKYPIFSTRTSYATPINETSVFDFATDVKVHKFSNKSIIEIDDSWEICYGSLTIDTRKFSNMKQLIVDIKAMGFRVTLWIHPFINEDCNPWHSEAAQKRYAYTHD